MNFRIPQANPKAENDELSLEIHEAIQHVMESGRYVLGPEVEAFEEEFAKYIGVEYGVGVNSGTDAITLALQALEVGPGDEVITVSHTAVATVAAIELCGAIPVLVDIDPKTYTLDPAELPKHLSSRTKVILPVHLYGCPADLTRIVDFADQHGLYILEDCAQAHGAVFRQKKVGAWGHIAAFSFYPTKNLGALGDGGLIATSDPELANRAKLLRQYGWKARYISDIAGANSRLDEIQAAVLRVKLRHLDENNRRRRKRAALYSANLETRLTTPVEAPESTHVYHQYVIRSRHRERIREILAQNGIGSLIHYPAAVHQQPAYTGRIKTGDLTATEEIVKEILSLPLYPQLPEQAVIEISDLISKALLEVGVA